MTRRVALLLTLICTLTVQAQTDLTGRVYHNPNILSKEFSNFAKEMEQKKDSIRTAALSKAEEKKGRKLTDKEIAEVDEQVEQATKMMEALKKGMKTAITVEFKNQNKLVMKADLKISEDVLKSAGISWMKRKALKAALAVAPSSQKGTYVVQDNLVITDDGHEKDTMQLSADGKQLSGKFDKKTKFILTRTK